MIHFLIFVMFMFLFVVMVTWIGMKPMKRSINYVKTLKEPKYKEMKICLYIDITISLLMYIIFIILVINILIDIGLNIQYINLSFLIIVYMILFILGEIIRWIFSKYKSKLR